jgi:hypothetical protein
MCLIFCNCNWDDNFLGKKHYILLNGVKKFIKGGYSIYQWLHWNKASSGLCVPFMQTVSYCSLSLIFLLFVCLSHLVSRTS